MGCCLSHIIDDGRQGLHKQLQTAGRTAKLHSVVSGAAKKVKLLNAFEPVGLRYQILPMTGLKALPALELRRQAELLAGSRARPAPPYSEAV